MKLGTTELTSAIAHRDIFVALVRMRGLRGRGKLSVSMAIWRDMSRTQTKESVVHDDGHHFEPLLSEKQCSDESGDDKQRKRILLRLGILPYRTSRLAQN